MPILDFHIPALAPGGGIRFALARTDDVNSNQYMLVFPHPYGMAYSRKLTVLNSGTSASAADAPALSSAGYPLIWFDVDADEDAPKLYSELEDGLLNAMLAAEPPVLRQTGRTRSLKATGGKKSEGVAHEVEILLKEDQLARICCYCGSVELVEPERFAQCSADATHPLYRCFNCSDMSWLKRNILWAGKRLSGT